MSEYNRETCEAIEAGEFGNGGTGFSDEPAAYEPAAYEPTPEDLDDMERAFDEMAWERVEQRRNTESAVRAAAEAQRQADYAEYYRDRPEATLVAAVKFNDAGSEAAAKELAFRSGGVRFGAAEGVGEGKALNGRHQ